MAVHLAGGHSHLTAVDAQGDVWVYGSNEDGQLGDGGVEGRNAPPRLVKVNRDSLSTAQVLKSDGDGGEGTSSSSSFPSSSSMAAAVTVGAGGGVSLAVTRGGDLFAWGKNNVGQIARWGVSMKKYCVTPVLVSGPSKPTTYASIAAGGGMMGYEGTTLVNTAQGRAMSWGQNEYAQLAHGWALHSKATSARKFQKSSTRKRPWRCNWR
jgi:alpha-tubulin suppressor-like RCC1 family protein